MSSLRKRKIHQLVDSLVDGAQVSAAPISILFAVVAVQPRKLLATPDHSDYVELGVLPL